MLVLENNICEDILFWITIGLILVLFISDFIGIVEDKKQEEIYDEE